MLFLVTQLLMTTPHPSPPPPKPWQISLLSFFVPKHSNCTTHLCQGKHLLWSEQSIMDLGGMLPSCGGAGSQPYRSHSESSHPPTHKRTTYPELMISISYTHANNIRTLNSWSLSATLEPCLMTTLLLRSLGTTANLGAKAGTNSATLRTAHPFHHVPTSVIVAGNIACNAARVGTRSPLETLQPKLALCSLFPQHRIQY